MTWKQLAEVVLRPIAGGDISTDFPFKYEDVWARAQAMLPFLMKKDFYESYKIEPGTGIDASFFTTVKAVVEKRSSIEKYINLPGAPAMLHRRGTPLVFYPEDRSVKFTYIDAAQYAAFNDLGVLKELSGPVMFLENREGDVAGKNEAQLVIIGLEDGVKSLMVRYVQSVSLDEINPDGDIPAPGHVIEEMIRDLSQVFAIADREAEDQVVDGRNDQA